jgi:hypothetical protein
MNVEVSLLIHHKRYAIFRYSDVSLKMELNITIVHNVLRDI